METRSLDDLAAPDERTLLFTPWGLGVGQKLTPDDACEFQQAAIADAELVDDIPQPVLDAFERLRRCHVNGVLSYDNFTIVADLTSVVLEQALRERFIGFYDGQIPLQNKAGLDDQVEVGSLYDLSQMLRKGGSHAKGDWRLRPKSPGPCIRIPTSLAPLLSWASRERLLPGQRNRARGSLLADIRNYFAHGAGFRVGTPAESARRIGDLAEIVNRLWGVSTPGGRLYPAPVRREVRAIAWLDGKRTHCRPEQIPLQVEEDGDGYAYVIVRCAPGDQGLWDFDSRNERTMYPCDFLWGPGDAESALLWYQAEQPDPDEVEHLDRLFVVRVDEDKTYLPLRPEVFAGLPASSRQGNWHLIRADFPNDAFAHVRARTDAKLAENRSSTCPVDVLLIGGWAEVLDELGGVVLSMDPPAVRVPGFLPDAPDVGSM